MIILTAKFDDGKEQVSRYDTQRDFYHSIDYQDLTTDQKIRLLVNGEVRSGIALLNIDLGTVYP